jgi:hypothetical protein
MGQFTIPMVFHSFFVNKLPEGIMLRQSRLTSRFRMREQLFQENYEHHKRPKTAGLCTGLFSRSGREGALSEGMK